MDTNDWKKVRAMRFANAKRWHELEKMKNTLRPAAVVRMNQLGIAPKLIEIVRRPGGRAPVYNVSKHSFCNVERPDKIQHSISRVEESLQALVYFVIQETIPLAPGSVQIRTSFLYVNSNIVQSEPDSPDAHDPYSVHAYTHSYIRQISTKRESIIVRATPSGGLQRCERLLDCGKQADQEAEGDGNCEGAELPQEDMAG